MKKKIMVVDDDPDLRYTIKDDLEELYSNDYEVVTVESGMKCLQYLKNNEIPDIILLDIMMPEMTGWETLDRIKENNNWRKIPVFFLTARTDRMAKSAGEFLGDDYIEKPYELVDLKNRLDKILKR
ncbi:MAG: response regulator [Candidatus Thermoplasmatota archaeon]|nr:response regulator [Candidatus Thermoplasmatota archaeon]